MSDLQALNSKAIKKLNQTFKESQALPVAWSGAYARLQTMHS